MSRSIGTPLVAVALVAAFTLLPGAALGQVFAQADCTGVSSWVDIDSLSHSCPDNLTADGDWSVTNADRVKLEYYVDSTRIQSETRSGTSGSWSLADEYSDGCGHTFKVVATPQVWNGSGYADCDLDKSSVTDGFEVSCTTPTATITDCDWTSCSGGFTGTCDGSCDATVSGGAGGPFTAYWTWTENGSGNSQSQGSSSGNFTLQLTCDMNTFVNLEGGDSECGTDTDSWPCGAD